MTEELPNTSDTANAIWAIRNEIQELENSKDEIISYLRKELELAESEDHVWIGDAKEVYYNIVAAWQFLNSCLRQESEKQKEKANSSLKFLEKAKSYLGQSASELKALKKDQAAKLEKKWKDTFDTCFESISLQLEKFLGSQKGNVPSELIEMVEKDAYTLSCTVCGKVTTVFIRRKKHFVYSGMLIETPLRYDLADKVFEFLKKKDLKGLQQFLLKKSKLEEGMDAYCPECDSIYCPLHYDFEEEWDEGFYDCTYGTCPEGHRRMVHD